MINIKDAPTEDLVVDMQKAKEAIFAFEMSLKAYQTCGDYAVGGRQYNQQTADEMAQKVVNLKHLVNAIEEELRRRLAV